MNSHRFLNQFFLALFSALLFGPAAGAAEPLPEQLTEDSLLDLLEGELRQNVESDGRFTPLPHAVKGGTIVPNQAPLFSVYRQLALPVHAEGKTSFFLRSSDGFRVLFGGRIVGQNTAGECVITDLDGRQAAIMEGDNLRPITLPGDFRLNRACFVDGRWVYMTHSGIFTAPGGTAWPESEHLPSCALVTTPSELAVVGLTRNQDSSSPGASVFVGVGKDSDWGHRFYANVPLVRVSGLVRHNDGHLIVVGDKLVSLRQDMKPAPTEAQLMAAHQAAENEDMAGLEKAMTELTLFPAQALSGLVSLLQQKQYDPPFGEKVEATLQNIQQMIESLREASASAGKDGSSRQLKQVLDRYLEQTKKTLEECRQVSGGPEEMSLRGLANLIWQGFQLYEGRWIEGAQVIWQESLAEALVMARHRDPATRSVRYAIFRLTTEGHLQPIIDLGNDWPFGRPSVLKDKAGRLWVLARGGGLARIEDDRFEWVDQSVRMRGMGRILGCDGSGRFILEQDFTHYPDGGHISWLYNMNAPTEKQIPYWWYPSAIRAAADDLGRLWFISYDHIPASRWTGLQPSLRSTTQPAQRKWQLAPGTPPIEDLSGRPGTPHQVGSRITLYCLDNGDTLHRYFSLPADNASQLRAGVGGAVLLQTRNQALLLSDDVVYGAKDLSQLVQQYFDVVLAASPKTAGQPPRGLDSYDMDLLRGYLSWFRAGDIVWLAPYGQLEAYKGGSPLSIQTRLTLLKGPTGQCMPIGPLARGEKMLVFAASISTPFRAVAAQWIVQTGEGIHFEPTQQPTGDPPAARSDPFAQVSPLPLVDYESDCLYLTDANFNLHRLSGPDRVEAWGQQGDPLLSLGDGRVLVRAHTRGMLTYRLVSAQSAIDVPITFLKPLKPILLEKDSSMLCLTPEGLAWIGPDDKGQYELRRNLPIEIPGYAVQLIGRSRDRIYLMPRNGPLVAVPVQ